MGRIALSKREEELMDFLWKCNKPLTAMEILDECEEHSWSDHYLRVMLRSLERKGLLVFDSLEQRGPQYARRFRCVVSREEYYVRLAEEGGVDVDIFVQAAIAALLRSGTKGREEAFNKLKEVMEKYSAKDDER